MDCFVYSLLSLSDRLFHIASFIIISLCEILDTRYHDGGRLSDQQMALLQYQRENIHYLSEEV